MSPPLYRGDPSQLCADAKVITDQAVAKRAYAKFLARGSVHGYHREDWADANRELIAEAV